MHWWLFALVLGLDTMAMYLGKQAAQQNDWRLWSITALIFAVMGGLFVKILQYETLTVINLLWVVGAIILGTILGLIVFKEQITGLQWLGLLLSILGVIFLMWPTK